MYLYLPIAPGKLCREGQRNKNKDNYFVRGNKKKALGCGFWPEFF